MIVQVNEDNYEKEVLDFDGVVMIDFHAPWCGPCKMMHPVLESVAEELEADGQDSIKIVMIDVDESPTIASDVGIRGVPSLKIVKEGNVTDALLSGANSKDKVLEFINSNL